MTRSGRADVISILQRSDVEAQTKILDERSAEIADVIANDFLDRHPELAARSGCAGWQVVAIALLACALPALTIFAPMVALGVLAALVAGVSLLNVGIAIAGSIHARSRGPEVFPPVSDADLPMYTVLVPVYDEGDVVAGLVRHLAGLDYPSDRLEVLILVEKHDPETGRIARAVGLPGFVRIVELPPGTPRTKPRAVNLGLLLARGQLLAVVDAEDRPELDQLRKVAAHFAARDAGLACVQARLFCGNGSRNLLTRQSALESALRFGLLLPGMRALGMPIPLAGNGSHFRTATLRELGGWDAWNVAAGTDIGMRCRAMGYRTEMSDVITWESATHAVGPFIRQRTRWFKGSLMTAAVHSRHPVQAWRRFGSAGMFTLLGMIAAPVVALVEPVLIALDVVALGGWAWSSTGSWLFVPAVAAQVMSIVAGICIGYVGGRRVGRGTWQAVLGPIYRSVMWWVAAWRAVHQLAFSPYVWEKTPH